MKQKLTYSALIGIMMMVTGCGRIVDWGKDHFYQGCDVTDFREVPQCYLQSQKIYDEFSVAAAFDVLWLSDDVRRSYANAFSLKQGKSDELRRAFLRRQLEENRHFISFYVLVDYTLSFGDSTSDWSVYLDVGELQMLPAEIKQVDLSPEYQAFFGKKLTRFKQPYLVKFNARDVEGRDIITSDTQKLILHFRSMTKEVVMCWFARQALGDREAEDICL